MSGNWISARQVIDSKVAPGLFALVLSAVCLVPAHAATQGQLADGAAPRHHTSRHGTSLDDRIKALSQALDLDAKQQAELRRVLESQREQVRKVWDDTTIPAGYRVVATQAISDKTADQIRALLNDEQRRKYNPPKPRHETNAGSGQSVEDWMKKTQPK